jgi:hypothetical protein
VNSETTESAAKPEAPVTYGRWIGLGLFIVVVSAAMFLVLDSGTLEF